MEILVSESQSDIKRKSEIALSCDNTELCHCHSEYLNLLNKYGTLGDNQMKPESLQPKHTLVMLMVDLIQDP